MAEKKENLKGRKSEKSGGKSLTLNVAKVVEDFQKSEDSSSRRKGTLKIDAPLEKALDTILRVPHQPKSKAALKNS
jgi:hypothetical protein